MKAILNIEGTKVLIDTSIDTMLWSKDVDAQNTNKIYMHIGRLTSNKYFYNVTMLNGVKTGLVSYSFDALQKIAEDQYDTLSLAEMQRLIDAGILLDISGYE